MYRKVKNGVFNILHSENNQNKAAKVFDLFIIGLIIINLIMVIADTFTLPEKLSNIMSYLETFSVIVFSVEYILRVWTADLAYPDLKPAKARMKYMFSFMALIDLIAILPFYIPFIIKIDLRALRALRTVRLLRMFKMNRYTKALSSIADVFKRKASQLQSSVFVVFLLMLISSILMYQVEHSAQPGVFKNAFSGIWWAVATFTTVGYGDIYPVTAAGKILSAIIALLGIALVAVPTGIITAGFMEQIDDKNDNEKEVEDFKYCPHCGKRIK